MILFTVSQQESTYSILWSHKQILGLKTVQGPKIPTKEEHSVSNHMHMNQSLDKTAFVLEP